MEKLIKLIKTFEGLKLKSYLCPAGRWTIGFGSTFHPNGTAVKEGETISLEEAELYLKTDLKNFEKHLNKMLGNVTLKDNQYFALLDFVYNCGPSNLRNSTLLKLVKENPNNPLIRNEFLKWTKSNGKELLGLKRRREAEANMYFS